MSNWNSLYESMVDRQQMRGRTLNDNNKRWSFLETRAPVYAHVLYDNDDMKMRVYIYLCVYAIVIKTTK